MRLDVGNLSDVQLFTKEGPCAKCGTFCLREVHHVTYKPTQVAPLCRKCHAAVTRLNYKSNAGTYCTKRRVVVWKRFMKGAYSVQAV